MVPLPKNHRTFVNLEMLAIIYIKSSLNIIGGVCVWCIVQFYSDEELQVTDCALSIINILYDKRSGCRVLHHHGGLLRVTTDTDVDATGAPDKVSHQV